MMDLMLMADQDGRISAKEMEEYQSSCIQFTDEMLNILLNYLLDRYASELAGPECVTRMPKNEKIQCLTGFVNQMLNYLLNYLLDNPKQFNAEGLHLERVEGGSYKLKGSKVLERREYLRNYMKKYMSEKRTKVTHVKLRCRGESDLCICTCTDNSTVQGRGGTGEKPNGHPVTRDLFDVDASYDRERGFHPDAREILGYLNQKSARHYRATDRNLKIVSDRLREKGVDVPGVKAMIDRMVVKWGKTDMDDYLRPETLFGASKFDGYYAARLVPVKPLTRSEVPPHVQLRVVEEEIMKHPANRKSTYYKPNPTPAAEKEFKALTEKMHVLKKQIAASPVA